MLEPQPGPQTLFVTTPADIAFYGGAAGGGKSTGLLIDPLKYIHVPGYRGVIFRRESTQITSAGGLYDASIRLYPDIGGKPRITPVRSWQFPSGAEIAFGHLHDETDVLGWQGAEICGLAFDELSHFLESQFLYMLSRNRSTCGVPPYVRATTNPDADSWIVEWIDWWVGEDGYPIKQRSGVLRWFVREDAEIHWGDSKEALLRAHPGSLPRSFTFIAATLSDNPALTSVDPAYRANLLTLNRVERERLLFGNWKIRASRGSYFPRDKLTIVQELPALNHLVRGWDLAATEPSESNPSPDRTASVLIGCTRDKRYFILDAIAKPINAWAVRGLLKATADADHAMGRRVVHVIPQDPGQAGVAQMNEIAGHLSGHRFKFVRETGSKEVRAQPLSAMWQAGNVAALDGSPWLKTYLAEMEAFPSSAHDDQIDASTSAFNEMTARVSDYERWVALGS
jgi:predicted phage terminase large subunit-like protein